MFKLEYLQTPEKSHLLKRTCSNKFSQHQNPQPVRLSVYHQQRSKSKSKLLENSKCKSPWKKGNQSKEEISNLHLKLEKLISDLISKLEEKRRSLLESYEETELVAAERILGNWFEILSKQESKVTSSCYPVLIKQNLQRSQAPQIRFRGATFSSIPSINTGFELQMPVINISCASNSKSAWDQTAVEKEFDGKSTTSMQMDGMESENIHLTSSSKFMSSRRSTLQPPQKRLGVSK